MERSVETMEGLGSSIYKNTVPCALSWVSDKAKGPERSRGLSTEVSLHRAQCVLVSCHFSRSGVLSVGLSEPQSVRCRRSSLGFSLLIRYLLPRKSAGAGSVPANPVPNPDVTTGSLSHRGGAKPNPLLRIIQNDRKETA